MSPDLSLHTALSHLLARLTSPLDDLLPASQATLLRTHLRSILTLLYAPSWHADDPSRGSAFRSLIGRPRLLPRPLRQAAAKADVNLDVWEQALATSCEGLQEWQCWCDPGRVQWRNGGWEWEDGVWFFGGWKDITTTVWSAAAASAPTPRVSHAVTIRSPIPATPSSNSATPMPSHLVPSRSVTPPTPTRSASPTHHLLQLQQQQQHAPLTSANLLALPLPPHAPRPDSPSAESDVSSSSFTSVSGASTLSQTSSSHPAIHADGRALLGAGSSSTSNGGHKRISSASSSTSSTGSSSLLAPPMRSTSPLDLAGRKKPVTAYDGGKVGVLGGGVKLGGGAPTSPRKPRHAAGGGGGYQMPPHGMHGPGRSRSRGPFGQPVFGAQQQLFHQPMPYAPGGAPHGVFNVGY